LINLEWLSELFHQKMKEATGYRLFYTYNNCTLFAIYYTLLMLYNYQASEKTLKTSAKIMLYLEEIKEMASGSTNANLVKYIPIKNRRECPVFIEKYKNIASPTQLNEIANQRFRIEEINTQNAYKLIDQSNILSVDAFLASHKQFMSNLLNNAGEYRKADMNIRFRKKSIYTAPPAIFIPSMISTLFNFLNNTEECLIIKSCVLYNQIGLVHPFSDGNGRLSRIMMNAELTANNEMKIIIPTIYRSNYLSALKALSQNRILEPFVRTLDFAQRYTQHVDWSDLNKAKVMLTQSNAFMDPREADEIGIRLTIN